MALPRRGVRASRSRPGSTAPRSRPRPAPGRRARGWRRAIGRASRCWRRLRRGRVRSTGQGAPSPAPGPRGAHRRRLAAAWTSVQAAVAGGARSPSSAAACGVDLPSPRVPAPSLVERDARTGSELVRVLPPIGGRRAGRTAPAVRHLPHRREAAARCGMGLDVVYLPPIHPIGRIVPQGTQQHPRRRPGRRRASRGRSASPRAGTTPCTPTSAPSTTSGTSSARPRPPGLEVALDLALQAVARPSLGAPSTRSGSRTRADGTIAYAENPPKKYQDIYPINFDTDPEGILTEVLRVVRCGSCRG